MFSRIFALIIRYKTLVVGSIPRLISVFWWPSIQIVLWGFSLPFWIQKLLLRIVLFLFYLPL